MLVCTNLPDHESFVAAIEAVLHSRSPQGMWLVLLRWTVSACAAGVILIMGALGYSRRTFRTWMVLPNLALFPLAILVVYILDYKLHLH